MTSGCLTLCLTETPPQWLEFWKVVVCAGLRVEAHGMDHAALVIQWVWGQVVCLVTSSTCGQLLL